MKTIQSIAFVVAAAAMISCGNNSKTAGTSGNVNSFDSLMNAWSDEQLVDVRTPEEFAEGHLIGAQNYDWENADFATNVNALDKTKPVMVYCRSGNRSKQAAEHLRNNGFQNVYEMEGGITAWAAAGKPTEQGQVSAAEGVSLEQYNATIANNDVVLVDFAATWCGPCKLLAPSLDELEKEMAGKFVLLRVDVDRDRPVADYMNIEAMPTLVLYKKGEVQWRNEGLVPKETVQEKLNSVQ